MAIYTVQTPFFFEELLEKLEEHDDLNVVFLHPYDDPTDKQKAWLKFREIVDGVMVQKCETNSLEILSLIWAITGKDLEDACLDEDVVQAMKQEQKQAAQQLEGVN
jgi:hypothetical protein